MNRLLTALTMTLLLAAGPAAGEQFVDAGGYRVHYAALISADIPADAARALGIRRSRTRALLVLNTQRFQDEGAPRPVPARAEGTARNLIGQVRRLDLRPVQEQDAHYLIAELPVDHLERYQFEIRVTPQDALQPVLLRFSQVFHVD